MQSFVTNRRTNMKKLFTMRDSLDDFKENSSPDDNLRISNDFSPSRKTSGSSNLILRLSETEHYSIEDGTTQSFKATNSTKQKSQKSDEVIVISDSSDDGNILKKPISRFGNFKKFNTSSIYISSSSDESDEGDDFILKYTDSKNTISQNIEKRRTSNNFKSLTTFRQRCSILYTSDDTASTASSKSKDSSKKSKVSATSSISHVSPTPQESNLTNDRPCLKILDKIKNPTLKSGTSPSFCSTKYQKLFPRKVQKPVSRLSKAEALKILKIIKSKSLNYFSASDSEKSQVSDSPDFLKEKPDRRNTNVVEETASERSEISRSIRSQKSKYFESSLNSKDSKDSKKSSDTKDSKNSSDTKDSQKSSDSQKSRDSKNSKNSRELDERQKADGKKKQKTNIVEETESEEDIDNSPKRLQIRRETVIKILQTPPPVQDPNFNSLSARKRKEIAHWLMTNNPDSNNDSSVSHISESNRNSLSSGNSSLERLEINYETPNNRDKFLKLNSDKRRNDEEAETFNTNRRKNLDFDPKTVFNFNSDKRNLDNFGTVNLDSGRRNYVDSKRNYVDSKRDNLDSKRDNLNSKRDNLDSKRDNLESKTPSTGDVLKGVKLVDTNKRVNVRTPLQKTPITFSDEAKSTGEKRQTKIDEYLRKTKTISGKSITVLAPRKDSVRTPVNNSRTLKPEDVKIEDCVDILDKLYGDTWRAKADAVLTEPRKPNVVKKDRGVQTERKLIRAVDRLNIVNSEDSEEDLDFKKFVRNVRPTLNSTRKVREVNLPKTTQPKVSRKKEIDDFINDKSSSDGSVPSSYYTAVSNLKTDIFKKKQIDTPTSIATIRAKAICDPDSDESLIKEPVVKNNDFNRRRLSYSDDESGSSTSEFDPDDIIQPKTVIKKRTVSRAQHFSKSVETSVRNLISKKTYSFLASLDASVPISCVHPDAKVFRENFKKTKELLCQRLFALYNEKIFDNKLPSDMLIDWSTRMRGTAGFCYNKKSIKSLGTISRSSRIVLSTKVLDRSDRLRDTLIHEMCHAATWIINEVSDGHGPIWKGWAKKAMRVFPELPPVSVCHNYKIHTKFTYKCTGCGYSVGRHSKSLNVQLKRCGYCYGKFELFINRTTKSGNIEMKTPTRSKDPSAFALYVKDNYQNVKQNRRSMKHGEVMKVLGQQFSAIKIAKKQMASIPES